MSLKFKTSRQILFRVTASALLFLLLWLHAAGSYAAAPDGPVRYKASGAPVGQIGVTAKTPADNPADNIFHVVIPAPLRGDEQAWLVYELDGVQDHTAVSRGINDRLSVGGYLVKKRAGWALQRERVDAAWLRRGDNVIRFTLPQGARHSYRVRNIALEIQKSAPAAPVLVVNQPEGQPYYQHQAYVKGYVPGAGDRQVQVRIDGKPVRAFKGEFEGLVARSGKGGAAWKAVVEATLSDGRRLRREIAFARPLAADYRYPLTGKTGFTQKLFTFSRPDSIQLAGTALAAAPGARRQQAPISITTLRQVDIPALDPGMVNVTAYNDGVRYLPHGTTFEKEVSLRLAYDKRRIPEGYTEKDIKTYFFDEATHHWVALPTDSVSGRRGEVASRTTHFTDMINAIITVPESPEAQAYHSTSMKGIKAADPTAAVNLMSPPQANNTGSASVGYPIAVPGGRQGLQPQLAISYNSGGGDSWLGLGWNLSTPALTIDTRWGVPRYDAQKETETYSLNGEQLSPVAHRGEPVARTSDKQFYPRVEGAFSRIIRHGSGPKDYWWEVTDKSGVKSFYGGGPGTGVDPRATLADEAGNIAHWALTETRDLNGNFVRYHYDKVTDVGVAGGKVPGYQLYVDKITYTGFGSTEGKYSVLFTRDRDLGESRRKDVSINARYGFKQVTADLLRRIEVQYAGQPVRSYQLQYKSGAFYKTLLSSIGEHGADGKLFTTHTLDYYDDVQAAGSKPAPFKAQSEAWQVESDWVDGVFSARDDKFRGKASVLGGTRSTDKGLSIGVGVGFDSKVWLKTNSITANVGFTEGTSQGMVSFLDLNGDGLPDKVFVDGSGKIWFRPNLSGPAGASQFGMPQPVMISGVKNFYKEKSNTLSTGLQAQFGGSKLGGFVAGGYSKTKSTTSVYFSDVNGDQLPDLVAEGRVYFNHRDANTGAVVFTLSSADTPSIIAGGAPVPGDLVRADPQEREEILDKNPLHDMVRMWEAPADGRIAVTAPVQLLAPLAGAAEPGADGVQVAIQLQDKVLWEKRILAGDYTAYPALGVGNLVVRKGDRLFFRLQSVENGYNDSVSWSPQIAYIGQDLPAPDANGKALDRYRADEDFLLSGEQEVSAPYDGQIALGGTFSKPATSDAVRVEVLQVKAGVQQVVFQQDYAAGTAVQADIIRQLAVDSADVFKFRVLAATNVDWTALSWRPSLHYTAVNKPEVEVKDADNKPLLTFQPVPYLQVYAGTKQATKPYVITQDSVELAIRPVPAFEAAPGSLPVSGQVVFSIKKPGALVHKQTLQVVNGAASAAAYKLKAFKGDSLYLEYHFADSTLAAAMTRAQARVVTGGDSAAVDAGAFYRKTDGRFGPFYRGWGHFSYNGNGGRATQPINRQELRFSQKMAEADESDYKDKEIKELEKEGVFEPGKENFIALVPLAKEGVWNGFDNYTRLNGQMMQSSRYGVDEVPPADGVLIGAGQFAVSKISESRTTSVSGGVNVGIGGDGVFGAGLSANTGFGPSRVLLDFMDMNGDRYPDVVSEDKIQYSQAQGGLSDQVIAHRQQGANQQSTLNSVGASLSGSFVFAKNQSGGYNIKNTKVTVGSGQSSLGVSGNYGLGFSSTDFTYADINGDGLPDRLYRPDSTSAVTVALNLGYRFAEPESWNLPRIQSGSSKSYGGGLGVDVARGSISAGVSLSRSENKTKFSLQDVNGDGLPDMYYLSKDGSQVLVQLNTGTGFSPEAIPWQGATAIGESRTSGQSVNAAFTAGFPILKVKIIVNPGVSAGQSVSRDLYGLQDVDGDGFADFLESDQDDELKVKRSAIGRTNLLRSVQRPLGAAFVLNYERLGNTYEMPQAVWALSRVALYDGFQGDGPDSLLTTFAYGKGYYDRHEREFYGFEKVITRSHDTGNKNALYTRLEQAFGNGSYYEKGLPLTEKMQDAAGKPYVEKEHQYELRDAATGAPLNLAQADPGRVFPALVQTQQRFYEGQAQAGKSTRTSLNYDRYGNVTDISDYGDEGAADDLFATVQYHYQPGAYLMGQPKAIAVKGTDKTYRKREADIDARGKVTEIRQYLDAQQAAVHNLEYDGYGNLSKVTRPANAKGERLSLSYEYDGQVQSFVTAVSNSYGYRSQAVYDYRFGQVLNSKDINGNEIRYEYDALGRVTKVTGPYELRTGAGYSILFEYHPEATVPWALTRHYDAANPKNDMQTATFADGLGRVVQTKKDGALFQGEGATDKEVMIVSGRVLYDGLGRATRAWYPVTEALGTADKFNALSDQVSPTMSAYDVMGRTVAVSLPDGAVSTTSYGFGTDREGRQQFRVTSTDANGKLSEQYTDSRGQVTAVKNLLDGKPVWTSFAYNAMGEQLAATDDQGHSTTSEYDGLGRRTSRRHPDAGLNTYRYDLAGNLVQLLTANLQQDGNPITYSYQYERLTDISYPLHPENNVHYSYGQAGAPDNRAGRIVLQEDATGAQEFFYGPLGEVVKNVRTVIIPQHDEQTYTTEWSYDTWSRLTGMVYPDGEKVSYSYNTGGKLANMSGRKGSRPYSYVKQLGYDKFEQRAFLAYGNGTKTTYNYEADRRRLQHMTASTSAGRTMMDNSYVYDKASNILELKNTAPVPSSNLMGGASEYHYSYDDLYRLTQASGSYQGSNQEHRYQLQMSYNTVGGILEKVQVHERRSGGEENWQQQKKTTYSQSYAYSPEQPHAAVHIGQQVYSYDANGNQTGWKHEVSGQRRQIVWDEENRIQAIVDNGSVQHYVYDASGERVLKGSSAGQAIHVNKEQRGGTGGMGNYTVYVNPYLVLKSGSYTKHYYIEGQRITSKLGAGWDIKANQKAGGDKVDFAGRKQRLQEGLVKNLKFLGADGTILTAGRSGKVPPGQLNGTATGTAETFQYYFHPDHLGSTSYITDASGEVYQHLEYIAFGETFVEEHSNTDRTPYLFNGKELDEETGLYYYGARYYDPKTSIWQSVDPLAEKMPAWSSYNYSFNNPIRFVDPDGMEPTDDYFDKKTGMFLGKDNAKTTDVRVIDKKSFKPGVVGQGEKINNNVTDVAAINIANHYFKQAGGDLNRVDRKSVELDERSVASTSRGKEGGIKVTINKEAYGSEINDRNDFINLFVHELDHGKRYLQDKSYTYVRDRDYWNNETTAVKAQVNHSSWSGTSIEFKDHVYNSYGNRNWVLSPNQQKTYFGKFGIKLNPIKHPSQK